MTDASVRTGLVMVTHNSARHLSAALDVMVGFPARVVDNASDDESVALVRAAGIEVEVLTENIGFGAAANRAVSALPEAVDVVMFVNPDLVIDGRTILRLRKTLDSDPGVGVVAPRLKFPDGQHQLSARDFPSLLGLLRRGWRSFSAIADGEVPARPDWVIGAAMMVRRSQFAELGGFDERFFLYAEDVDLCWRYRRAGWSVMVDPAAVALHEYGRASKRKLRVWDPIVRMHWTSIARLGLRYPRDFAGAPRGTKRPR